VARERDWPKGRLVRAALYNRFFIGSDLSKSDRRLLLRGPCTLADPHMDKRIDQVWVSSRVLPRRVPAIKLPGRCLGGEV
jgi:hypothetical protein